MKIGFSKTRLALALTLAALLALPALASAASVAPDPGGSESVAMSSPPPGKYMGFNDDSAAALHGLTQLDYIELTRNVNGNLLRTGLDWRHAEPERDTWNERWWGRWQTMYDQALARDVTLVFRVGMAPTWARDPEYQACVGFGACEYPPAREMDREWAEYVAEVARRFPQAMIEVWNSANFQYYWESGADPERFAELLVVAHDAIKAESPSTMVLAGGLSNNQGVGVGSMALGEFLDRAYAAEPSIRDHMDAISFHNYPQGSGLGANTLFAKAFDDVRSVRAKYGDSETPLFITEIGVSSAYPDTLDQDSRASTMLAAYRRIMTMPDVIGVAFHRLAEPSDTTAAPWELGSAWTNYGAMTPSPRPVYCRFVAEAGRSYPGCLEAEPVAPEAVAPEAEPVAPEAEPVAPEAEPVAPEAEPVSPELRVEMDGARRSPARRRTFWISSSGSDGTFECQLDRSRFRPCSSPHRTKRLSLGRHLLRVRGVDTADTGVSSLAIQRFRVVRRRP